DGEYAEIGDDHVDDAGPRQRQSAFVQELGFVLGRMLHHNDHLLDAGDEVHGAAHALDHLAGYHPVGEVAVLSNLHGAEHRQINVSATHHAEAVGAREIAGGRQFGHGLLPGIDEIGILLAFKRERASAEHAVFTLQLDVHAWGDVVRHQRRNADAEIDIEA